MIGVRREKGVDKEEMQLARDAEEEFDDLQIINK